jgi:Helix-turn-helix domain
VRPSAPLARRTNGVDMASARGIQLDEDEVLELALLQAEQQYAECLRISASCRETINLLRKILRKPPHREPTRPQKQTRERRQREPEEEEEKEGLGAILRLPPNNSRSLTLEDVEDDARYDVKQAAEVLEKSAYTIRSWVKEGKIHADREGRGKGQFFVPGSEIRRLAGTSH